MKITVANIENPVYVKFATNPEDNGFKYKNAASALALFDKLSNILDFTKASQDNVRDIKNLAEFQLKKISEFKSSIIRQSAS